MWFVSKNYGRNCGRLVRGFFCFFISWIWYFSVKLNAFRANCSTKTEKMSSIITWVRPTHIDACSLSLARCLRATTLFLSVLDSDEVVPANCTCSKTHLSVQLVLSPLWFRRPATRIAFTSRLVFILPSLIALLFGLHIHENFSIQSYQSKKQRQQRHRRTAEKQKTDRVEWPLRHCTHDRQSRQ